MIDEAPLRPLMWIGTTRKAFSSFPNEVKAEMGYALFVAQAGGLHRRAKPLKGFGGSGVLEVVSDFRGDTYRAVYTVRFADTVFVLHAFQKKSSKGIATRHHDMRLIEDRLKAAELMAERSGKERLQ